MFYTRLKKGDHVGWAIGGLDGCALNFAIRVYATREERDAAIAEAYENGFIAQAIARTDAEKFLGIKIGKDGISQEELDKFNCNPFSAIRGLIPDWDWTSPTPWAS